MYDAHYSIFDKCQGVWNEVDKHSLWGLDISSQLKLKENGKLKYDC